MFKKPQHRRSFLRRARGADAHLEGLGPAVHRSIATPTEERHFRPGNACDILLVGAGHTHLLVLKRWIERPIPNARITLISESASAWYSGMLPQVVSGRKEADEIRINAARLAKLSGGRLVVEAVTGLDPARKTIHFTDRPPMAFDYLSLNLGAVTAAPPIQNVENTAQNIPIFVPVKPLSDFLKGWQAVKSYLDAHKKRMEIAVVGGGVASIELVLAIRAYQRLCRPRMVLHIHLITRGKHIAPELSQLARESLRVTLMLAHITIHYGFSASHIGPGGVFSESGSRLTVDAVIWATQVVAPAWCKASGLACDDNGFISVTPTLQTLSHQDIFAVGDLAHFTSKPLPKAGVYAVREAQILADNLALLAAQGLRSSPVRQADSDNQIKLKTFRPQKDFLKLLNLNNKKGLFARNGFTFSGRWVLRWKMHLDNQFLKSLAQPDYSLMSQEARVLSAVVPVCRGDVSREQEDGIGYQVGCNKGLEAQCEFTDLTVAAVGDGAVSLPYERISLLTAEAALADLPLASSLSATFKTASQLKAVLHNRVSVKSRRFRSGLPHVLVSTTHTPLIWGDLFRLGRHATLWSLGRILGQPFQPQDLRASLVLPSLAAPLAERDSDLVMQGIYKVLADQALNPFGVSFAGLQVRQGDHCAVEMRLTGTELVDSPKSKQGMFNGSDAYSVICTHPLGAGYWGHAALSGQLCATAWAAMTEACFKQVASWWEVLNRLYLSRRLVGVRLIEADGVIAALKNIFPTKGWHLKADANQIAFLPDLRDSNLPKGTLYEPHPAVDDNFWRLQRDFDVQPAVAHLCDWPKPLRALVDANVGLSWVLVVKSDQVMGVLTELTKANLPNAFCLGELCGGNIRAGDAGEGASAPWLGENTLSADRVVLHFR